MANIISSFSFNLVYPAAAGDPAYPVLLLSCLPRKIYAQRELLAICTCFIPLLLANKMVSQGYNLTKLYEVEINDRF